jgi:hypothetical protein
VSDPAAFLALLRNLERHAVALAYPSWEWAEQDAARITVHWPTPGDFTIDLDVYRAGELARHTTYTGQAAVDLGMALMAKSAE